MLFLLSMLLLIIIFFNIHNLKKNNEIIIIISLINFHYFCIYNRSDIFLFIIEIQKKFSDASKYSDLDVSALSTIKIKSRGETSINNNDKRVTIKDTNNNNNNKSTENINYYDDEGKWRLADVWTAV